VQASVGSSWHPIVCTLSFGKAIEQSAELEYEESPAELHLQGSGPLTGGQITLSCTASGHSAAITSASLSAHLVSGVN
jgi:hypothetical protein